jgi:DNA-binding FrmR family transcriptional regulator
MQSSLERTPAGSAPSPPGYATSKDELLGGLRRVEDQVREIEGMVSSGRHRMEVVTQVAAIQAALDAIALGLVDDHARHCIAESGPDDEDKRTADLMGAVGRLIGRS